MTKREKSKIRQFRITLLKHIVKFQPTREEIERDFAHVRFTPEPGVSRVIDTSWAIQNAINSFRRSKFIFNVGEKILATENGRGAEAKFLSNGDIISLCGNVSMLL
jgi:hypothetical protein